MVIKKWNGKAKLKGGYNMATISFMKESVIDNKAADILISQMERAKKMPKHTSNIDIEENMREGRRLLANLLSKRQK